MKNQFAKRQEQDVDKENTKSTKERGSHKPESHSPVEQGPKEEFKDRTWKLGVLFHLQICMQAFNQGEIRETGHPSQPSRETSHPLQPSRETGHPFQPSREWVLSNSSRPARSRLDQKRSALCHAANHKPMNTSLASCRRDASLVHDGAAFVSQPN